MKKTFYLILTFFLILISCNKDRENLKITDFSKQKNITLKPYNWKIYTLLRIKVKGYTNDSIRINFNLYGNSNFFISGNIDTLLVCTDYYGEGSVTLIFDPYKATNGSIEIDFNL